MRTEPNQCEPSQIKQLYVNVLKNAFKSMPHKGYVSLVTVEQLILDCFGIFWTIDIARESW